jgi:hypothetical protein
MRLHFPLLHLFHLDAPGAVSKPMAMVPVDDTDEVVPSVGLWSGALMALALGISRNRLPAHQRAGGRAKRAMQRNNA